MRRRKRREWMEERFHYYSSNDVSFLQRSYLFFSSLQENVMHCWQQKLPWILQVISNWIYSTSKLPKRWSDDFFFVSILVWRFFVIFEAVLSFDHCFFALYRCANSDQEKLSKQKDFSLRDYKMIPKSFWQNYDVFPSTLSYHLSLTLKFPHTIFLKNHFFWFSILCLRSLQAKAIIIILVIFCVNVLLGVKRSVTNLWSATSQWLWMTSIKSNWNIISYILFFHEMTWLLQFAIPSAICAASAASDLFDKSSLELLY